MTLRETASKPVALTRRTPNARGHGDLLRQDLLASAGRILQRDGSENALTIRAVTREAGLAPQSFYLQFASISELTFALYEDGYQQLERVLANATALTELDANDRLGAVIATYLTFAADEPGLYGVLMQSRGSVHPDWDAAALPGAKAFAILRASIAAVHPDQSSDLIFVRSTLLWTQLHGVAILLQNLPTFPWPTKEQLVQHIIDQT